MQIPFLQRDGTAVIPDMEMFHAVWEAYVSKGALAVVTEEPLELLQQVLVRVVTPEHPQGIELPCEVVHRDPYRTLLRLIDVAPDRPEGKDPSITMEPVAELWGEPSAEHMQGFGDMPNTIDPLAPPKAPKPAPPPATLLPVLQDNVLSFPASAELVAARTHMDSVGAVMCVFVGLPPPIPIEIRLSVSGRQTRTKVKVLLAQAGPGTVVAQATERSGFRFALNELESASTQQIPANPMVSAEGAVVEGPTMAPAESAIDGPVAATSAQATVSPPPQASSAPQPTTGDVATPRAFSLPRKGKLHNPTTPAEILRPPLVRAPTDAELARPSMPMLLRWLRTARGVMRLEATAPGQAVYAAVIVEGREVRSPASIPTLGKSFALPEMEYELSELGRPPQLTTTGRTLHLIVEVIRGLCAPHDPAALASAFPNKEGMCPRAVTHIAEGLGFSAAHQRFIKNDLDGNKYFDELLRAPVGARTVLDVLYALQLYEALAWDAPPENRRAAGKTGSFARTVAPEPSSDPFAGKDHFHVLGIHWSASPNELAPAYQKMRHDYGPGGMKRPVDAKSAEACMHRIEEAFRVLSHTEQRRAHRREKYNMVWPHQAQLLIERAKLTLYRKEYEETMNLLTAAEDMHPTPEAKALMQKIFDKQKAMKPK